MNFTSPPSMSDADHLLLAPLLLRALEAGRMPMHASSYLEITALASRLLKCRDTELLRDMCTSGPGPLQAIVENVMHERGVPAWSADDEALRSAEAVWHALFRRLSASPGTSS